MLNEFVKKLVTDLDALLSELYASLPVGWVICVHENPKIDMNAHYDIDLNEMSFAISQIYHPIYAIEDCTYTGRKTVLGPKD